jgi:hypothetical protein
MNEIRLVCRMKDVNSPGGFWCREITFPCFPYPGLIVGHGKVKSVHVCQGGFDGGPKAGIEVRMKKTETPAEVLEAQGWKWEE